MDDTYRNWAEWMWQVAGPVYEHARAGQLGERLPALAGHEDRQTYAAGEALCRTLAGLAPWLQSDAPAVTGKTAAVPAARDARAGFAEALDLATDPGHPAWLGFNRPGQPLVEAGFLALALLRAPRLWSEASTRQQDQLAHALISSRQMLPWYNNWLLFSATVEAALASMGRDHDTMRLDYALRQLEQWYLGDGIYGDGPQYHADYYNSYVIQPMLLEITETLARLQPGSRLLHNLDALRQRFDRFVLIQERSIAPDGSFPPVGRSLTYRAAAFHALALAAYRQRLPEALTPASVRGALGAVIQRTLSTAGTFNPEGWLNPGLCGHQPTLAESYISRGSLYLCTTAFLPLGLPPEHRFWTDAPEDWSSRRIFGTPG